MCVTGSPCASIVAVAKQGIELWSRLSIWWKRQQGVYRNTDRPGERGREKGREGERGEEGKGIK